MRTRMSILVLFLLLATPCLSQIDPDPDGIGIYFDTQGTNPCLEAWSMGENHLYVLLTRPSCGTLITGASYGAVVGGSYAWLMDRTFAAFAVVPQTAVVLEHWTLWMESGMVPSYWYVYPDAGGGYSYGCEGQAEPIPLQPSGGYDGNGNPRPMAAINHYCEGVLEPATRTWGALKNLYR